MSSFEAFFYPPFLGALSEEFHPPQTPGVDHTLRQIALNAVEHQIAKPDREPDGYGETRLTYRYSLPWTAGVESAVDGRITGDLPRLDIVYLYDTLTPLGSLNELSVSIDESRDIVNLDGIYYQLALSRGLHAARVAIASAAQKFFDQAQMSQK